MNSRVKDNFNTESYLYATSSAKNNESTDLPVRFLREQWAGQRIVGVRQTDRFAEKIGAIRFQLSKVAPHAVSVIARPVSQARKRLIIHLRTHKLQELKQIPLCKCAISDVAKIYTNFKILL